MAEKIKIGINSETLVLARREAGYPAIEDACAKSAFARDNLDKLVAFEQNKDSPTPRQLKELSKMYHVQESLFLMPPEQAKELLTAIDQIKDFRMGGDRQKTPELIRFLRDVVSKQDRLSAVLDDEDIPEFEWIGSVRNQSEEEAGHKLRELIWKNDPIKTDLKDWISRTEDRLGVAVMQPRPHFKRSITQEISGIAINHDRIPVIVLNANDKPERRIFTLLHELAHLMISAPGISKTRGEYEQYVSVSTQVEQRCNEIAEHALMPRVIVERLWNQSKGTEENIKAMSNQTGASLSACNVRAYHLKLIDQEEMIRCLNIFRKSYSDRRDRERAHLAKRRADGESTGGVIRQDIKARDEVGPRMTLRSLLAYDEGRLSARDLHDVFGVKLNYLNKIANQVGYELVRWNPPSSKEQETIET